MALHGTNIQHLTVDNLDDIQFSARLDKLQQTLMSKNLPVLQQFSLPASSPVLRCVFAVGQVTTRRRVVILQRPRRHNDHAHRWYIPRVTTTTTAAMVPRWLLSLQEPLQRRRHDRPCQRLTLLAPASPFFLPEPRQRRRLSRHSRLCHQRHRLNRQNPEPASRRLSR